jgi:hypothetical protein
LVFGGRHRSILSNPDGTGPLRFAEIAGTFGLIRKGPGELEVRTVIEPLESVEAELADPLGAEFSAGGVRLLFDPVDDQLQLTRIDVALVRGPRKRTGELRPVEGLTLSVPLQYPSRLGLATLEAGEAAAALSALAAPANRGAVLGAAALQHLGLGAAGWTLHDAQATRCGGPEPFVARYI